MCRIALALGIVVTFCSAPVAAQPPAAAQPKWEYVVLTESQIESKGKNSKTTGLNELGKDGWELIAIDPAIRHPSGQTLQAAKFYFKRPAVKLLLGPGGGNPPPAAGKDKKTVNVYTLKFLNAVNLVKTLQELLSNSDRGNFQMVADATTNTIIVDAGPGVQEVIESLIGRLETLATDQKPVPKKT
jgi:hypothetical protein